MTIFAFDIDGTICSTVGNQYDFSVPDRIMIEHINSLYEQGHYIKMFTGRGCVSKKDWTEFTKNQLTNWGLKFHELITNQKPHFDLLIDDKAINIDEYKKNNIPKKIGIFLKNFDLINFEYIKNLEDARQECDYLIVCLNENHDSHIQLEKLNEKQQILKSIKYVDQVVYYSNEENLKFKLKTIVKDNEIHYINS